jgi:PAS domain-containing protein
MTIDIDEGKKAEGQRGFAAQLQAILNVLPAYTWYGALTFVNKRTAEYLGFPKDHPLRFGIDTGAQWDDWVLLLHPDDQEEARKYWLNSLHTGEAGEHSYRVRSAQGDYRWFLTRFEPQRQSNLCRTGRMIDAREYGHPLGLHLGLEPVHRLLRPVATAHAYQSVCGHYLHSP